MQGPDVFPIPGTKRLKYLEENAAAYFVELTAEDKRFLEETFHVDKVSILRRINSRAHHLESRSKAGDRLLIAPLAVH